MKDEKTRRCDHLRGTVRPTLIVTNPRVRNESDKHTWLTTICELHKSSCRMEIASCMSTRHVINILGKDPVPNPPLNEKVWHVRNDPERVETDPNI